MIRRERILFLALGFSLLLHLVLLAVDALSPIPVKPEVMEVEYVSPPSTPSPEASAYKASSSIKHFKKPSASLRAFEPRFTYGVQTQAAASEESSSWEDPKAYESASMNPDASVTHAEYNFLSALWHAIDNEIVENPFLSEYNHTGQVFTRFELDSHGELVASSLHVQAEDRVLKVLALRALRKALKELPENFGKKWSLLSASFNWASYEKCRELRGTHGNFLSFCHYAENKKKNFTTGERLKHHAAALATYGPFGIVEEVRKYNREESRRNEEFDPFEELERDPDWNR